MILALILTDCLAGWLTDSWGWARNVCLSGYISFFFPGGAHVLLGSRGPSPWALFWKWVWSCGNGAFFTTLVYLPQFTFVCVKSKLSGRYNISQAYALSGPFIVWLAFKSHLLLWLSTHVFINNHYWLLPTFVVLSKMRGSSQLNGGWRYESGVNELKIIYIFLKKVIPPAIILNKIFNYYILWVHYNIYLFWIFFCGWITISKLISLCFIYISLTFKTNWIYWTNWLIG